jgi:hypothetical protein
MSVAALSRNVTEATPAPPQLFLTQMQRIVQQIDQGLPCGARKKRGRSQQDTSMQLGRDINAVVLVDQTFRHHPARMAQANASEITGSRHQCKSTGVRRETVHVRQDASPLPPETGHDWNGKKNAKKR